jgi:predicted branched-subunit amino acid permease
MTAAARAGCRDAAAVTLAYLPLALAVGATLASTSVDPLTAGPPRG